MSSVVLSYSWCAFGHPTVVCVVLDSLCNVPVESRVDSEHCWVALGFDIDIVVPLVGVP